MVRQAAPANFLPQEKMALMSALGKVERRAAKQLVFFPLEGQVWFQVKT